MSKSIPEMSADNRLLIELFVDADQETLVTHKQMNECVGRSGVANLMNTTIRNALLRDHDIVLGIVVGQGYKKLKPAEIANGYALTARKRARRAARRTIKALATVNRDALTSDEDRRRYDLETSIAGVTQQLNSPQAEKKLSTAIEAKSANGKESVLALAETLNAMITKR